MRSLTVPPVPRTASKSFSDWSGTVPGFGSISPWIRSNGSLMRAAYIKGEIFT